MEREQIILVLLGALAGGFVNGLTGFGTGITAIGVWLYAISPHVAASLAIICSIVSQLQTLPMIWRSIEWTRVLPCAIPGLLGVSIGTLLLPLIARLQTAWKPRLPAGGDGAASCYRALYSFGRVGDPQRGSMPALTPRL
jgi:uncharacterized membrane protein YfcA